MRQRHPQLPLGLSLQSLCLRRRSPRLQCHPSRCLQCPPRRRQLAQVRVSLRRLQGHLSLCLQYRLQQHQLAQVRVSLRRLPCLTPDPLCAGIAAEAAGDSMPRADIPTDVLSHAETLAKQMLENPVQVDAKSQHDLRMLKKKEAEEKKKAESGNGIAVNGKAKEN